MLMVKCHLHIFILFEILWIKIFCTGSVNKLLEMYRNYAGYLRLQLDRYRIF